MDSMMCDASTVPFGASRETFVGNAQEQGTGQRRRIAGARLDPAVRRVQMGRARKGRHDWDRVRGGQDPRRRAPDEVDETTHARLPPFLTTRGHPSPSPALEATHPNVNHITLYDQQTGGASTSSAPIPGCR
jgi:hypothetical protein